MSEAADDRRDGEALWRFAVTVYGQPGVAARLVELQDRQGLDVNLALFCAWFGWSGRGRLTRVLLERADQAVAGWRRDVVEPLRAVRRALKGRADPAGVAALRQEVQRVEIEAERLAQHLLAAALPSAPGPTAEPARRADAAANLALYCDLLQASPQSLDFIVPVLSVAGS